MTAHKSMKLLGLEFPSYHFFSCREGVICTYRSMVLLQHLHVRVIRQTLLAHGREICRLPSASVQILLDLGRHVGDVKARRDAEVVVV
jgi:hypothetical protein